MREDGIGRKGEGCGSIKGFKDSRIPGFK